MPLKRCVVSGVHGYKWGDSGACYTGKDGKAKAMKQARAIEANKTQKKSDSILVRLSKTFSGHLSLSRNQIGRSVENTEKIRREERREIRKNYVYRYITEYFYTVVNNTLVYLGYSWDSIKDTISNMDAVIDGTKAYKFSLIITRSHSNMEVQSLSDNTTMQEAQLAALDLVTNGRNTVECVHVAVETPYNMGGSAILKAFVTYYYMESVERSETLRKMLEEPDAERTQLTYARSGRVKDLAEADCLSIAAKLADTTIPALTDDFKRSVDIVKHDFSRGLVYGVVYEPDTLDTHGDYTSEDEIERAAHDFLPRSVMDIQHDGNDLPDVEVVESYIAPCSFKFASGEKVKKGSWVIVSRVNNAELRKSIESGAITGYSLEGKCSKVEREL